MMKVLANNSLSINLFLGIGADKKVPDYSTLTLFKNRVIEKAGRQGYEELLKEIIKIAQEKEVRFGKLQIVDSVHLIADVNIGGDR